ncbi:MULTISPECIES: hypothetical protein [Bacillus]|uniref:hypothetical protein n=1 Tax=Bacillus TaxID=1386 RepID=UPI000BB69119|nr:MULTISPECIES: hypothetical protein [Bacillus]
MKQKFTLLFFPVIAITIIWFVFYGNKPLTLEKALEQEMPYYQAKEIIHIEKLDEFAIIVSKANPDKLTNSNLHTEYTIPVIDIFVKNDKKGWERLNSSWKTPRSFTDDLTYFFKFLPSQENRLISFGDINNPDIQTVKVQVSNELIPANIIEDSYGNKTYFLIHDFEPERIVTGHSENGEILFEINKRH